MPQNEEWKQLRKRFNPGFAHQHLMTLLPVIAGKCETYLNILDGFVNTGKSFPFDQLTTNLTFDIIGAVTMGEDMNAQHLDPADQGQLIVMIKEMIKSECLPETYGDSALIPQQHMQMISFNYLGGLCPEPI